MDRSGVATEPGPPSHLTAQFRCPKVASKPVYARGCPRMHASACARSRPPQTMRDLATQGKRPRTRLASLSVSGGVTRPRRKAWTSSPRRRDELKRHFSAVVAALIALSVGGGEGSAQAAGATSPPSRSESHHPAAAVDARAGHHTGVARRADWSTGPVAFWSGYSQRGGSLKVREVQRTLRALDYRPGLIDGLFGPLTERAVLRFQRAEGLESDGIVGPHTLRRLRVRVDRDRPTTSSPGSRSRSPDRPTGAPRPKARPARLPPPSLPSPRIPAPTVG